MQQIEIRDKRLYSALDHMPMGQRLMLLVSSVIEDTPGATPAVAALISLATGMATRLSVAQQLDVARHMHLEARSLEIADGAGLKFH
jgi:hypothetical protein